MIDKLLIPVDGSDPAKRAAKYGLELAVTYDAAVDLLHVMQKEARSGNVPEAEHRDHGNAVLDEVLELELGAGGTPSIETHLASGKPSKVIIDHVAENDIDLVSMGRHGRSGVGEYLFGTVTERVLRSVEAPVLTVTNGEIQNETGATYENVLLTTDGSDVAERAAPYGADLARRTGATVHLLSVVDVQAAAGPFDAGGVSREYVERLERDARDALDRLTDRIDGEEIELRSTVAKGTPSTEIATYADDNDIDLLVLASEGETNLVGQHLGSVTRRVLRTVRRPILVIPTPD